MNVYVKRFLHRGLMFGGFGPIVTGIVYLILSMTLSDFSLSGREVFTAILSTYVLAFLQAGASVFNQIEEWPLAKSLLLHFLTLYIAYSACYLVNTWIPLVPMVLLVFSLLFLVSYLIVWLTVYLAVKATGKRLNKQL